MKKYLSCRSARGDPRVVIVMLRYIVCTRATVGIILRPGIPLSDASNKRAKFWQNTTGARVVGGTHELPSWYDCNDETSSNSSYARSVEKNEDQGTTIISCTLFNVLYFAQVGLVYAVTRRIKRVNYYGARIPASPASSILNKSVSSSS